MIYLWHLSLRWIVEYPLSVMIVDILLTGTCLLSLIRLIIAYYKEGKSWKKGIGV